MVAFCSLIQQWPMPTPPAITGTKPGRRKAKAKASTKAQRKRPKLARRKNR